MMLKLITRDWCWKMNGFAMRKIEDQIYEAEKWEKQLRAKKD